MKITIPEPCQENWDQMTPKEKGRHCDKCAKQVVDFTPMSDGQIVNYLKNNPGSCGRFYNYQLNKELATIPKAKSNWWLKAAAGTLAFSQLFPEQVTAQNENVLLGDTVIFDQAQLASMNSNFQQPNALSFTFDAKSLAIQSLRRMVFDIDSFQMPFENFDSGKLSFSIPKELEWNAFQIHFYAKNSNHIDTLKVQNTELNDQFGMASHFVLSYDKEWNLNKPVAWTPYFPKDVITMGIPPIIEIPPFDPLEIKYCTIISMGDVITGFTQIDEEDETQTGNYILASELSKSDSMQEEIRAELAKAESPTNNWHWALGLLLSFIGSLIAIVFTGKKK